MSDVTETTASGATPVEVPASEVPPATTQPEQTPQTESTPSVPTVDSSTGVAVDASAGAVVDEAAADAATKAADEQADDTEISEAKESLEDVLSGTNEGVAKVEADEEEEEEVMEVDAEGKPKSRPAKKPRVQDWEGAPEFQWRTVTTQEDRKRLVIENVCISDMQNAFLYAVIQRADQVEYKCTNSSYSGPLHIHTNATIKEVEHNVLRSGCLTLTFVNDTHAMNQAVHMLVFMRSRPNKRMKVFLPQTPGAMKMRKMLEGRLGNVNEQGRKFRRLFVRNIKEETTEDQVKAAFKISDDCLHSIEFKKDSLDRQCAVVEFKTAAQCMLTHCAFDEVHLGVDSEPWAKVFYAYDVVMKHLLFLSELRADSEKFPEFARDAAQNKRKERMEQRAAKLKAKGAEGESGKDADPVVDADGAVVVDGTADGAKSPTKDADAVRKANTAKQQRKRNNRKRAAAEAAGPGASTAKAARGGSPRGRGGSARGAIGAASGQYGTGSRMQTQKGARGAMRGQAQYANMRSPQGMNSMFGTHRGTRDMRGRGAAGYNIRNNTYGNNNYNRGRQSQQSPWASAGPQRGNNMGQGYQMQSLAREQQQALDMRNQLLQQQQLINELQTHIHHGQGQQRGAVQSNANYTQAAVHQTQNAGSRALYPTGSQHRYNNY